MVVDLPGEVALEAATDLAWSASFGGSFLEVWTRALDGRRGA